MEEHVTELIPGYALNSLDLNERLIAEKHISECEICRVELRAYEEVVSELAFGITSVQPPDTLKKQVMDQFQTIDHSDRKKSYDSWWRSFVNFFRNTSPIWVVASLLLIIFLGVNNLYLQSRVNKLSQEQASVNLPVINLYGTDSTPDAIGVLVVSADGEHGTLIADRLPALDESKQYQLWLIKDGERESGGVFSVSEDGYGSMWVDSEVQLSSYNAFGITIEPYGGSIGPTGDKVLGSDDLSKFNELHGSDL